MDLLRRTGAGELARAARGRASWTPTARMRPHQFRQRARAGARRARPRAIARCSRPMPRASMPARRRSARGPSSTSCSGQSPVAWRAEDSILVVYAMWIDLQGLDDADEQQRGRLAAALPVAAYAPAGRARPDRRRRRSTAAACPRCRCPSAEEYDLRKLDRALFESLDGDPAAAGDRGAKVGSNNWAVAGGRVQGGGALVANDMHLGLRVPNIWYRARSRRRARTASTSPGVSLPGVPAIVAGSNGHVAWGFTNSYGDFQDLMRLEPGPQAGTYLTADGPRPFDVDRETIDVAGDEPETLELRRTVWGPVIGDDGEGHELALAWTAHRAGRDRHGAARPRAGAGSRPGRGRHRRRRHARAERHDRGRRAAGSAGCSRADCRCAAASIATRPSPWHAAGAGWQGWMPREEAPRLLDPPSGLRLERQRARRGRRGVRADRRRRLCRRRARAADSRPAAVLDAATPADMLAIQLDDRADYLAHWQPILLQRARASAARPRPRDSSPAGAAMPRSTTPAIACCATSSVASRRAPSA